MNKKRICAVGLAAESSRTSGMRERWARLLASLLLACSTSVLAQDTPGKRCESERQKVISATQGGNKGDTDQILAYIRQEVGSGDAFRHCHTANVQCTASFRKGVQPTAPDYGDALKAWADVMKHFAETEGPGQYQTMLVAQYFWHSCLARNMAVTIKPTRPYQ